MSNHNYLRAIRRVTTRLRQIPGAILFLNPIRRYFAKHEGCINVSDFDGDLKATLCLDEHIQSKIFWYGYCSRDIVLLLKSILKPGMTVIDVGANIGEITMIAAHKVGKNGRVFSFEPMGAIYVRLLEHISSNQLSQVTTIKCGLADRTGEAQLFSASNKRQDGTENFGLGTLYSSSTRATPTDIIAIDTLDRFAVENNLNRVDVIKIDVEGAELAVLRGAGDVISRHRPYLIIEIQQETSEQAGYKAADILEFLDKHDYRFYRIARKAKLSPLTAKTLRAFQNVLCTPREKDL